MKKFTLFSLLFALVITLAACAPKKTDKFDRDGVRPVSLGQAQVVTGLPGRYVNFRSPLKFIFAKEMVSPSVVGQADGRKILSFKPALAGKAVWLSRTDLEFQPDEPMKKFQSYTCKLHLDVLQDDPTAIPIEFMFESIGNEVVKFEGEFKLADKETKQFSYEGEIQFSHEVEKTTLEQALQMKSRAARVVLQIEGPARGKQFVFKSPGLEQGRKTKLYTLILKSDLVNTAANIKKEAALEAGKRFYVKKIEIIKSDDQTGFVAHFSDVLSQTQSPDGFVKISPAVKVQLKSAAQKLYILGDFAFNQEYRVEILKGIKNRWEEALQRPYQANMSFKDIKPFLRFTGPGVFLPTTNDDKVTFETMNVKEVRLQVQKVFADNIGQFLQTERLHNRFSSDPYYPNHYEFRRVGVSVKEETLYIGEQKNTLLVHALDLKKILSQEAQGLFIVKIWYNKDDMLYANDDEEESADNSYWSDDYHTNPYNDGYREKYGTASIQIIVSDIGLTVKKGHESYHVIANHLKNTKPLFGVKVRLMSYQNQIVAQGTTNAKGVAAFSNVTEDVFYAEGELGGQRSVVKLSEMAWNLTGFEISGAQGDSGKNRAFIYTDRGVYRPGDPIHLTVLVRNQEGTFPKNHPVTLKFFNPKDQLVTENTVRDAEDGFYYFPLKTEMEDMTGNWRVEIEAGGTTILEKIKIETVVPNRLKVNIEPSKKSLSPADGGLILELSSIYLFGAPAADLKAKINGVLENDIKSFEKFPDFIFTHEGIPYRPYRSDIFSGRLNAQGKRQAIWQLPAFGETPSGLKAIIRAKVFEKGGRFTQKRITVPVNPYTHYVGTKKMELDYGYFRIPNDYIAKVVLVTPEGKAVAGQTLKYRVYKNERFWWWEYRNERNRRLKFKTHGSTDLVKEGTAVTSSRPMKLKIPLEERGEYLLEIQHGADGHTTGYFFQASRWGSGAQAKEDAGNVIIKTDRQKYFPGDKARVRFPVPGAGRVLFSLERGNEVLETWWEEIGKDQTECIQDIPITEKMMPTTYVSVSILQPHAQTKNDLPLRLYGVKPLNVEDPSTRKYIRLKAADEIKPGKKFSLELQSVDNSTYQATIAVVDEGLLDLTGFQTPNPWKFFFRKMRLGIMTYDLYAYVIGANKGDIAKLFSIGGGESELMERRQKSLLQAKRFKPVAMFKGPLESDKHGKIIADFTMPNYIGAVRVMAVAAEKQAYGHADKTVLVRQALMIQPTLPRVLGPKESFTLPVNVIAMKDGVGKVSLQLTTEGPLDIEGRNSKTINVPKAKDQMVYFKIKTRRAVGQAKIHLLATAKKIKTESTTSIAVRPSAPRISKSETQVLKKGERVSLQIPNDGILNSNRASISIKRLPKLGLEKRLGWLIRYPYGCIEQTTSAVFPQLYLKSFLASDEKKAKKIDKNIQAGIQSLKKFVLPNGGFSYWPGGHSSTGWGTNYAGHFLLEAKQKGYNVPDSMLKKWKKYQHSQALKTAGNVKERVYRVYLLAMAGAPALGPMNLLKENNLQDMDSTEKWLLAAAYHLTGSSKVAREISAKAGYEVKDYQETGGTFGSGVRDQAIILETLVLLKKRDKAYEMFESLGESLSGTSWYSTQTVAYGLLAMGKYLQTIEADYGNKKPRLLGYITLPGGQRLKFDTKELTFRHTIEQGFGQTVEVFLDQGATQDMAYVTLNWDGVPLMTDEEESVADRMSLKVSWFDEDGSLLDESKVKQGSSFYGRITVRRAAQWRGSDLENVALVQIVPSGWEIENMRLSGEKLPDWLPQKNLTREDYLDIRDDRIMWFFNMQRTRNEYKFVVKVNAVTAGKFILPSTQVEAMYDNNYKATTPGKRVEVLPSFNE
ncbi:alpha-2-macroglobulin family protein [bacterium]|nr:alpha-2-macroglobulin family protein [bacterium]